jgi:hypothetical protein
MMGEANSEKPPRPGDDDRTLPPLLPRYADFREGKEPSDIERESALSMLAHSVMVHGKKNQLTPQQKVNLLQAFRYECAAATDIVEKRLRQVRTMTTGERLGYLKDYQALCRRLAEEVQRSLDRRSVDTKAVSQLCWDHLSLMEQYSFSMQSENDTLGKCIAAGMNEHGLPRETARAARATEDKQKRSQRPAAKRRRKTPPQLLRETRERQAAKELAKSPDITSRELGKILECDASTVVRLRVWKNRGVLHRDPPCAQIDDVARGDDSDTYFEGRE